jgi:hypothetical protein
MVSDAGKVETLFRAQYNALGKRNLAAIERIVTSKYQRGPAVPLGGCAVLGHLRKAERLLDLGELARQVAGSHGASDSA